METSRFTRLLAGLLPLLVVAGYIACLQLNLPFWDQWELVPLLVKLERGTLGLADLFSQHNDHRPFFPRLIWLQLARCTGYNTNAELWLNVSISLGTLLLFLRTSMHVAKARGIELPDTFLATSTLLVFNLAQWESWLLGCQTIMFLGMLTSLGGFIALSTRRDAWGLAAGVTLGCISTFSMANGVLFWPIGFLVIVAVTESKRRLLHCAVWLALSALVLGMFFQDWSPTGHASWRIVWERPVDYAHWVLSFLGSAVITHRLTWTLGFLSLVGTFTLTWRLYRSHGREMFVPYGAIVLLILGSGLSIGIGRANLNVDSSLASRYLTLTVWYWASLWVGFCFCPVPRRARYGVQWLFLSCLLVNGLVGGWHGYRDRYLATLPAYRTIRSGREVTDAELLAIYSVDPRITRGRLAMMCEHEWSACSGRVMEPALVPVHAP